MMESWTKEAIYDAEISPLMTRIIAICKEHDIPMLATFQFEHTEENGAGFCTTILTTTPRASDEIKQAVVGLRRAIRPPSIMVATTVTRR